MAVGLGAQVTILDVNIERLNYLETLFGSRVQLLVSNSRNIAQWLPQADLLIGAVLIPGKKAPILVSRSLVKKMRPGAVIFDVAVDQGGCIETLRVTSHSQPSYLEAGVVHVGIPNLPGAVPWTSTQALNQCTLPYALLLADLGLAALEQNPALGGGLNVRDGRLTHPALVSVFPDLASI
jgi:alanine dehydrogenase